MNKLIIIFNYKIINYINNYISQHVHYIMIQMIIINFIMIQKKILRLLIILIKNITKKTYKNCKIDGIIYKAVFVSKNNHLLLYFITLVLMVLMMCNNKIHNKIHNNKMQKSITIMYYFIKLIQIIQIYGIVIILMIKTPRGFVMNIVNLLNKV